MKALTIRQPWAGAIFLLGKDVENRSWSTDYRGLMLIHSAIKVDSTSNIKMGDDNLWSYGCLLGTVELVDCVKNYKSDWAIKGKWHWIFKRPIGFLDPIKAKGKLGLWETSLV